MRESRQNANHFKEVKKFKIFLVGRHFFLSTVAMMVEYGGQWNKELYPQEIDEAEEVHCIFITLAVHYQGVLFHTQPLEMADRHFKRLFNMGTVRNKINLLTIVETESLYPTQISKLSWTLTFTTLNCTSHTWGDPIFINSLCRSLDQFQHK